MKAIEIREKFLKFFEKRGHKIIPSSPLVPINDPTTLFTGSGMQPLVPYLLGEKHPEGDRLVNSQKCFRSQDIEEVGDNRHTTFFEMLGNWSLGDYFKKEQLPWFFTFLVDEVGLDPKKIYVSVFTGDLKNKIEQDTESVSIWKELFKSKGIEAKDVFIGTEEDGYKKGMQEGRIFYYEAKKNWWSRSGVPEKMPEGEPGGPDSELFYDFGIEHDKKWGEYCHPNCDCGRFLELGNSVFMQYIKKNDGSFGLLPKKNVDFGGGLERVVAAKRNDPDVFKIDVFEEPIKILEDLSSFKYGEEEKKTYAMRVVLDHLRAATFLISDDVLPGNKDQGYFVRRLIRRAVRYGRELGIKDSFTRNVALKYIEAYQDYYVDLKNKKEDILEELTKEEDKFRNTLEDGIKYFNKGEDPFILYTTYGFPIELTEEFAKESGRSIDREDFDKKMKDHQDLSRLGSEQKFKGGLADQGEDTVRLHTTHHLLLSALRKYLGSDVYQRGSNITGERLRIDFSFGRKMTDEEKKKVEDQVNVWITESLPVSRIEMKKEEAEKIGAQMEFGAKYPDTVSIYYIGKDLESAISKEFCGGPHVKNTKDIGWSKEGKKGTFKILKEEAVASGIRRIKASIL